MRGALAVAVLALLPACASSGGAGGAREVEPGQPVAIRYSLVNQGVVLALVNASHTDRTALYSTPQPLAAASTKVSPDEVVDELLAYFREQGLFELARAGAAPERAPGITQVLELELPGGPLHAQVGAATPTENLRRFQACAKAFRDLYNNTVQLQAVEQRPDWDSQRPGPPPKKGG